MGRAGRYRHCGIPIQIDGWPIGTQLAARSEVGGPVDPELAISILAPAFDLAIRQQRTDVRFAFAQGHCMTCAEIDRRQCTAHFAALITDSRNP